MGLWTAGDGGTGVTALRGVNKKLRVNPTQIVTSAVRTIAPKKGNRSLNPRQKPLAFDTFDGTRLSTITVLLVYAH
jgi:hypothetical protein